MDPWDYRRRDMDYTVGALIDIGLGLAIVAGLVALIFV